MVVRVPALLLLLLLLLQLLLDRRLAPSKLVVSFSRAPRNTRRSRRVREEAPPGRAGGAAARSPTDLVTSPQATMACPSPLPGVAPCNGFPCSTANTTYTYCACGPGYQSFGDYYGPADSALGDGAEDTCLLYVPTISKMYATTTAVWAFAVAYGARKLWRRLRGRRWTLASLAASSQARQVLMLSMLVVFGELEVVGCAVRAARTATTGIGIDDASTVLLSIGLAAQGCVVLEFIAMVFQLCSWTAMMYGVRYAARFRARWRFVERRVLPTLALFIVVSTFVMCAALPSNGSALTPLSAGRVLWGAWAAYEFVLGVLIAPGLFLDLGREIDRATKAADSSVGPWEPTALALRRFRCKLRMMLVVVVSETVAQGGVAVALAASPTLLRIGTWVSPVTLGLFGVLVCAAVFTASNRSAPSRHNTPVADGPAAAPAFDAQALWNGGGAWAHQLTTPAPDVARAWLEPWAGAARGVRQWFGAMVGGRKWRGQGGNGNSMVFGGEGARPRRTGAAGRGLPATVATDAGGVGAAPSSHARAKREETVVMPPPSSTADDEDATAGRAAQSNTSSPWMHSSREGSRSPPPAPRKRENALLATHLSWFPSSLSSQASARRLQPAAPPAPSADSAYVRERAGAGATTSIAPSTVVDP